MATVVILHVFSGRPDPSWVLRDTEALELRAILGLLRERTPLKARGWPQKLGYRGFSVMSAPRGLFGSLWLTVQNAIVDPGPYEPSYLDYERSVEKFLLGTAGTIITESLAQNITGELLLSREDLIRRHTEKRSFVEPVCEGSSRAKDAPPYEPTRWNAQAVRDSNNCYNYIHDQVLAAASEPGRAHGVDIVDDCYKPRVGVSAGALADGLTAINDFSQPRGVNEGWYVALAVWPGCDYHWYRQDSNGCWSHKNGQGPVTNLDDVCQLIRNPKNCDRGSYSDFCGYFVTKRGLKIG